MCIILLWNFAINVIFHGIQFGNNTNVIMYSDKPSWYSVLLSTIFGPFCWCNRSVSESVICDLQSSSAMNISRSYSRTSGKKRRLRKRGKGSGGTEGTSWWCWNRIWWCFGTRDSRNGPLSTIKTTPASWTTLLWLTRSSLNWDAAIWRMSDSPMRWTAFCVDCWGRVSV